MRLRAIHIENQPPINKFSADNLSDVIVIAGPNGVGKTRILQNLIQFLQNPVPREDLWLEIEATVESETKTWGKSILNTQEEEDSQKLRETLQKSQRRNNYKSTILQFESDRSITNIKPYQFTWDIVDPFDEDVSWNVGYGYLRDRSQDVRNAIFRRIAHQRREIADIAYRLKSEGKSEMKLDFPDPLMPFKNAFSQLLAPKALVDPELRQQQLKYHHSDEILPIETLSSGETEVVNIIFDFIMRNPSNCIILFDEPELHLHPELSYKLLQSLTDVGKNNQFIFCTHSPEIITASLENSVIFVSPPNDSRTNQAIQVNREDETHHALNLLGQSIGIISLGKKLVLIEGRVSSLDKQTYGAILKNKFPEFVLVPAGGKHTIISFDEVRQSILNKTIWGVEFFMLCDGDALGDFGHENFDVSQVENFRILPRYHIENYFLDENVLAHAFREMEEPSSWLCNADEIRKKLREIALETVPYAVALKISALIRNQLGNIDLMPKGIHNITSSDELNQTFVTKIHEELNRIQLGLILSDIEENVQTEYSLLENSINEDTALWRMAIPGKTIINKFANRVGMKSGRLKRLFLSSVDESSVYPFQEIIDIFEEFRGTSPSPPKPPAQAPARPTVPAPGR